MGLTRVTACAFLAASVLIAFAADAATTDRRRYAGAAQVAPKIVCGITGCFEVPPGCRHEQRAAGRGGSVAVIICGRR